MSHLPQDAARRAIDALDDAIPPAQRFACNNDECGWIGEESECCWLRGNAGGVGPLCPECRETVESQAPMVDAIPSAQPAPEPAALLPCPFCGNAKNLAMANERHDHSGGYFIACPACDASTGLRYATGEDPRPLLVEQWNRRAVRGHMGSTPDGGIDDHDEPRAWITPAQVHAAVERWPKSLTYAVDLWFAQNTGLGGCSDKDVAELAAIFYGVTHEGGRESVDDALAVVDSFGPGIDGLNDTYARQVLLAQEVRRLHSDYIKAIKGRQEMRQALRIARDHLDMGALRTSHCKDAAAIESALGAPSAPVGDGWQPIETAPKDVPVLLDIGKKYPIRAMRVEAKTRAVNEYCGDDFGEYDEDTDTYYWPAGWYEWNEAEERHWLVNETPLQWHALPTLSPSAAQAKGGA